MANPGQGQAGSRLRWVTERGLMLACGQEALARYRAMQARSWPEVEDVVPADSSLLVVLKPGEAPSPALLEVLSEKAPADTVTAFTVHEIPVRYGGEAGPDLSHLARAAGLLEADFIRLHAAAEYTVAFLGFQPGFAYLDGMPLVLRAPRRASPQVRLPAGSVAIGGAYTGIYPAEGPGGWHVIGQTRTVLFDPLRLSPALFAPGDRVRFIPS